MYASDYTGYAAQIRIKVIRVLDSHHQSVHVPIRMVKIYTARKAECFVNKKKIEIQNKIYNVITVCIGAWRLRSVEGAGRRRRVNVILKGRRRVGRHIVAARCRHLIVEHIVYTTIRHEITQLDVNVMSI